VKTILVTGGAGFIGSHLVRWLCEQNKAVRVLDNLSTGSVERLREVQDDITFIEGDIRELATVQSAMQGVELVFHLAAMISVVQSVEEPVYTHTTNATGSLHIFEAARQAGVQRVVQMSSSAVYGAAEQLPTSEESVPEPMSPYALTKLLAEQTGQLYTRLYGLESVSLRGFNIYGPGQDPSSPYAAVIPRFVDALCNGKQPTIFGDGHQSRDFVFVGDVVQALWVAAMVPGIAGMVLNIGRGEAVSVLTLAHMIGEVLEIEVEPTFAPPREGEIRHSCSDISRLIAATGFRPQVGLREGLAATVGARPH
jgi:nucleoside-diphosphate-sugar epimerase